MLPLFQLFLAVFAVYSALRFPEETRLFVALGCLVSMLIVARLDKRTSERQAARKTFLQSEINKIWKKESTTIKEQDFFTIDSLLWPKSELLLIDAVHFIFKDLGFTISAGIKYHSVDRIVRIPGTQEIFGLEMLISEGELEENHPKLSRALEFEKEKREMEKTLIIGSTHTHLPLSDRGQVHHMSKHLQDFLVRHSISFISSHRLYELWQKAKGGEVDLFGIFEQIYTHPGGIVSLKGTGQTRVPSFGVPTPSTTPH